MLNVNIYFKGSSLWVRHLCVTVQVRKKCEYIYGMKFDVYREKNGRI